MPEIEDIEFKVYTQFELFGWYKVYGIASGTDQFTIWDTKAKNSWECKNLGNGWYKTTIKLKAVKGEHEKNILLKKENNDNSPTITLFISISQMQMEHWRLRQKMASSMSRI